MLRREGQKHEAVRFGVGSRGSDGGGARRHSQKTWKERTADIEPEMQMN